MHSLKHLQSFSFETGESTPNANMGDVRDLLKQRSFFPPHPQVKIETSQIKDSQLHFLIILGLNLCFSVYTTITSWAGPEHMIHLTHWESFWHITAISNSHWTLDMQLLCAAHTTTFGFPKARVRWPQDSEGNREAVSPLPCSLTDTRLSCVDPRYWQLGFRQLYWAETNHLIHLERLFPNLSFQYNFMSCTHLQCGFLSILLD